MAANRYDELDGFAAVDRLPHVSDSGDGTAAVTELALADPPWDRPSRSFESLTVLEAEEEPDPMSSLHARRNELLYQLSVAPTPEIKRSIEARLALEERAIADKFRTETHEPSKKKAKKLLGKTDELISRLQKL